MLIGSVVLPDSPYRNYNATGTRAVNRKSLRFRKRYDNQYSIDVEGIVADTVSRAYVYSRGGHIPK